MFVDTQIISRFISDGYRLGKSHSISSVAAKELLECYNKKNFLKDKYYILPPQPSHLWHLKPVRERLKSKVSSRVFRDVIEMDFGIDYPRVREHGSKAISYVINGRSPYTVNQALQLHKPKNKAILRERFRGIIRSGVQCEPLSSQDIHVAFEIMHEFTKHYALKGDFRNSLNDILILAVAVRAKQPLKTDDGLLSSFASEFYGAPKIRSKAGVVVDFTAQSTPPSQKRKESKGYIHRGWRIAVQRDRVHR